MVRFAQLVGLTLLLHRVLAVPRRCHGIHAAMRQAASTGLAFYAAGSPTGAANTRDRRELAEQARAALHNASVLLVELADSGGGFEAECTREGSWPSRAAASICHRLINLLIQPSSESRRLLLSGKEPNGTVGLFDEGVLWTDLVHTGWPVFRLAALLENEIRRPATSTLTELRLYAEDPAEGCTEEQEAFRELAVLLAGEGRTSRITDVRQFLRSSLEGDQALSSGPKFVLDLLFGDVVEGTRCQVASAVAFAALADALQCHYQRPLSVQTHQLADAAVERAQRRAAKAYYGRSRLGELLTSRWPLVSLLARLEPLAPPQSPLSERERPRSAEVAEGMVGGAEALVSWSSREAELGGLNWAARFAEEVFGALPGVELRPDVECADIFIFRVKMPVNFGGVLLFVDGERSPDDGNLGSVLASYPATIVVGPQSAGGAALHFPVPYVSTSFASRAAHTPSDLLRREPLPVGPRRFAAYLAYRCWPHREEFYKLLDAAGRAAGLGGVDVLSRCGNVTATEAERRSERYSATYMDDAAALFVDYRFALVFENRLSPKYVTEKIVNAFLAGAVPIYWGSPFVLQIFNPRSFVYVNGFPSFAAAVRRVVELAQDPTAYAAYLQAPVLRNTTAARWLFSWHRHAPPLPSGDRRTLRTELSEEALRKHRAGLGGVMPAVERRPWDYMELFS